MKVECPRVLKRVLPLAGKKITEAISTNPVTEPFAVSVNIHRMPWRKFSRVILWNFATKYLWSWNIYHIIFRKGLYFVKEIGVTPETIVYPPFSVHIYLRGRVKKSLQPSFFLFTWVHLYEGGSVYLKHSCHVTWTVLHAWLHYGISIKTMHFGHY